MITHLEPDEIIVVGTNMAGAHGGGAARQAAEQFGLREGFFEGLCGQTYAFPTLNADYTQRTERQIMQSRYHLVVCANRNRKKKFLLTKVGCGIAGFSEEYMKGFFWGMPKNVIMPEGWEKV
jgi:hypothetical protein